jgi:hypothetical protein
VRELFEERKRKAGYEGFEVWDMARVVIQQPPPSGPRLAQANPLFCSQQAVVIQLMPKVSRLRRHAQIAGSAALVSVDQFHRSEAAT